MHLRATDAFLAGMTDLERVAVYRSLPLDVTVTGTKLGTHYRAELYRGGLSIGVGYSPTCAVYAIAEALEDRRSPMPL